MMLILNQYLSDIILKNSWTSTSMLGWKGPGCSQIYPPPRDPRHERSDGVDPDSFFSLPKYLLYAMPGRQCWDTGCLTPAQGRESPSLEPLVFFK